MALLNSFLGIFNAPTTGEMVLEMIVFLGPVWIAFLLGILLGWAWRPCWSNLRNCKFDFLAPLSSASTSRAMNSGAANNPTLSRPDNLVEKEEITLHSADVPNSSSSRREVKEPLAVTNEDFEHLSRLVERKDGGPSWKLMMERSTPDMSYQAWQRDPTTGPPQYCSRTVYEDTSPELLRDFFWDDEFRLKWDDMILHAETLEECPSTGTMVVHWIRKFPFFCSDREYIIGRRIWESGRSYYCVTKGVPRDSIPRREKPRRVDLYYSSWYIGPVESRKADGELSACEVILFHHEDMGIPWEIAKFGVRQGMWGAVRKIERGIQDYRKERSSGSPLTHCALMAQVNTKITADHLKSLENEEASSETPVMATSEKGKGPSIPKLMIIGGVVVVACTLDTGLLTKTLIFSVARRFANLGRKACPRT